MWYLLCLLPVATALFPQPNSLRHAYIIASTSGDLPSAARDVVTYGLVFAQRGFHLHLYLDVSPSELQSIKRQLGDVIIHQTLDTLPSELAAYKSMKGPIDLLVTISSHGWLSGVGEYIVFQGRQYSNTVISKWFTPLAGANTLQKNVPGRNISPETSLQILILVDTCHSGHMTGFPRGGSQLPSTAKICSISACSDTEQDSDDISDQFGFGGGLTTAVVDFIGAKESFDINQLYNQCSERVRCNNMHPQMCWL